MAIVCRQLAATYQAGIPIINALEITAERHTSCSSKIALSCAAQQMRQGTSLAEAFMSQSKYFPKFVIEALAAGEVGGKLDALLKDLAEYYEDIYKMESTIRRSLVYPAAQLIMAWFLGTFSLGLIRSVGTVFSRNGTRVSISDYFSEYIRFQLITLVIVIVLFVIMVILSRVGALKTFLSFVKNHCWGIKKIVRSFGMARFFRSMALLTHAGVDIKTCLQRSAALTLNAALERDLLRAFPIISQGESLERAFARCTCLTRVEREFIAVGEQTGNLDEAFHKLAEYNFNEGHARINVLLKLMPVVITLAVGVVVGFIVISFYGNLYGSALKGL